MTHREQNIIVSLISALLIFTIYAVKMNDLYHAGRFDAADAASVVGKSIFFLILASIAATIVATIAVSILVAIVTNEPKPSLVVDERDKLIELKGLQITFLVFSAGFIASMAALALGVVPYQVFLLIICAMFVGNVLGDIAKLYRYQKGY